MTPHVNGMSIIRVKEELSLTWNWLLLLCSIALHRFVPAWSVRTLWSYCSLLAGLKKHIFSSKGTDLERVKLLKVGGESSFELLFRFCFYNELWHVYTYLYSQCSYSRTDANLPQLSKSSFCYTTQTSLYLWKVLITIMFSNFEGFSTSLSSVSCYQIIHPRNWSSVSVNHASGQSD